MDLFTYPDKAFNAILIRRALLPEPLAEHRFSFHGRGGKGAVQVGPHQRHSEKSLNLDVDAEERT